MEEKAKKRQPMSGTVEILEQRAPGRDRILHIVVDGPRAGLGRRHVSPFEDPPPNDPHQPK